MSEIPTGWKEAKLGDVADLTLGKMLDREKRKEGTPLPYLRNINVRWNAFDLHDLFEMPFKDEELDRFSLQRGDVLICEGGEPGRASVWDGDDRPIKFQKAILRARTGPEVLPQWIMYSLMRDALSGDLEQYFTGSTIKHFPKVAAARYTFPLPPLPEQRRIVETIEALLARVNAARDRLTKVPAILKRLRQSILAAACSGRLTEEWRVQNDEHSGPGLEAANDPAGFEGFPYTWMVRRVDAICEIRGGIQKQPSRTPRSNAFPYLRVANVLRGRLDLGRVEQMELYGNELDTYRLQRGDLLVVEGNGSATEIGRSAIWEGDIDNCVHQNHIIRVRPLECEPEYLNLYWNSPSGVSQISSKAVTTTGLYSLSTRKVGEIEIPLPPRLEQREIVRRARRVLSVVDNIERSLSQTWTTSSLLQRSILAAAFKPGRE